MYSRFALAAALALVGAAPAPAPPAAAVPAPADARFAADLDRFTTAALARFPTVPAMGVAVVRSGGPVFVRSYGMADRERRLAAGPDTLFYIASSTKSFVGLMMARLAAGGRIDLNWTLAELAPDIRFAPEVQADKVTLRHLLSHSHGLAHRGIEYRLAYTGQHDPAMLYRLLGSLRANREAPLGSFNYGNLGYNIAALLIERKLGGRWQDMLAAEVFRPLALRHTLDQGIGRPGLKLAAPYAARERLAVNKTDATLQSAGGIYATMGDMARWVSVQLAAERGGATPIAPALVAQTHRPVATMDQSFGPFARRGYGLGWYSGPYREQPLYHSFGAYIGARAHTSFMPSRDLGVAIMSNDEEAGFLLVDVIAAYAYDYALLGPDAAAAAGEANLAKLEADMVRERARRAADRARRAARTWQLTLPVAAYAGSYCNVERGTLAVGNAGGVLTFRMGQLRASVEPFTGPDSARIELVPSTGEVIQFTRDGERVSGLTINGLPFPRCAT